MKTTTKETPETVGEALLKLRKRMHWNQPQLAREMEVQARKLGVILAPDRYLISSWERGIHAPSPDCRMTLFRIAKSNKRTSNLADAFRIRIGVGHVAENGDMPPESGSGNNGRNDLVARASMWGQKCK